MIYQKNNLLWEVAFSMTKPNGPVTIKSIAEALGISFSTVSKALNGDPAISETTRLTVEKKAKEMNYTRNYFAQSLRQKGSRTVAIIVNDIDIPAYGEMIAIISGKLAAHGYTTMVSDSRYSEEFERSSIRTVISRMPEAVIVAPADPSGPNLKLLESMYQNTLVLGDIGDMAQVSSLTVDHRLAGLLTARHLLKNGVQHNLILGGPEGYQSSELYLAGLRDGYQEFGIPFPENRVLRFRPDQQTAYRRFVELWQEEPGFCDGVACFCDSMAFGIYRACRELDLRIPEDISIIGYDDGPANEFTAPPLTSIHMPKDLVGAQCAQFVINRLVSGDSQLHKCKLEPHLVDRGSVVKKDG